MPTPVVVIATKMERDRDNIKTGVDDPNSPRDKSEPISRQIRLILFYERATECLCLPVGHAFRARLSPGATLNRLTCIVPRFQTLAALSGPDRPALRLGSPAPLASLVCSRL